MKKNILVSLIGFFLSLILSTYAFSLTLYDDFSGTYIDKTKWRYAEWVREIDPTNQRLLIKQASPSPIAINTYPYVDRNSLSFSDPNSVNSIQADITILQNDITNQADTRARIGGRCYNDGTSGGDYAGDIWASVDIRCTPTGLRGIWYVGRYTGPSSSSLTQIASGYFTTVINIGTPYRLYASYDSVTNHFLFKIGDEAVTFGPTGLPTRVGYANQPRKELQTRVQIDNSTSSGYISAAFDNVYVNDTLYDDFSSPVINPTKWITYEFVREISGGKLRSKTRSSSAYTSYVSNQLEFVDPLSINNFQTKVTLVGYQNPQGLYELADITGVFYNDGTPGGDHIGDVVGEVLIGGSGLSPVASWRVYKYIDTGGNTSQIIASDTFTTPITLGNTYTLFLGWNAGQFTFKIDSEEANYAPKTGINPANVPFKRLRTHISPQGNKNEGTIEALFDDVQVSEAAPPPPSQYTLTVSKSGTGSGTVTSNPSGIDCGSDCSESFDQGTSVTLTATPASGSTFGGWSGDADCSDGVVTMDSNKTCTATFNPQVVGYTLTVVKSGTGSGTVTSSPAGINCGGDCSETYSKVQKVKLTAKADANSTFAGWSGECSGTGSCQVTVDGSKTVTASFALKTPDISVAQTTLDFGSIKMGKKVTKTLKIANNGTGDLIITLSGLEGTDFNIQGSSSATIKGKKSCTLKVLFTPKSAESKRATLTITSNDSDTPTIDISLSGTGQ